MTAQQPERRVLVTYSAVPSLDVWQKVQPDLVAQLPLRNLHWKPSTRSLRTIQTLQLDLRALQSLAEEKTQHVPLNILERPYLHLLFVSCEVLPPYSTCYVICVSCRLV